MSGYSTHWTETILVAIAFHAVAALGFSYVLPLFESAPKPASVAEMNWVDVELSDDATIITAEAIPSDAPTETLPTFDAKDLVMPEIKIPEPARPVESKPVEVPPLEVKPIEPPPQIVNYTPKPQPKSEAQPEKESAAPKDFQPVVTRPPITINAVYPEKGSGLGFKGYVSFAAHIDKNGKVTSTEILQSSGRYFVDEIARKAAVQWTFKPALDQRGRPMECDKIITFDFKKFA